MVASSAARPPEPLVRATLRRLASDDREAAWAARRPGPFGRRAPPRPGFDRDAGPPGASRPMGSGPWAVAPVRVGDRVPAAVFVARGRPPGAIARELAPWLAAGLAVLLVAGTALAALAIFRPAHARLRDLESAVRRFGEGDRTARASTRGGDEVAAVADAFNRMADDAGARESALVEADRARRQLLADVSHELMTPLTAIRGYAETLTLPASRRRPAQGQRAVHVVGVEAQRLERLVNDLLDLARFEAGGSPARASHRWRSAICSRGSRSGMDPRPRPPVSRSPFASTPAAEVVPGDEVRLEQAVQNLAANALRHAPARRPRASSCATRDGDHVRLTVTDDGAGIDPAHLPHVFDRFYKADPSRAGSAGTGPGTLDRQGDRRASRRLGAGVEHARRADDLRGPAAGVRLAGRGAARRRRRFGRPRRGRRRVQQAAEDPLQQGLLSASSSNRSPRSMRSALPVRGHRALRGHEPAAQRLVDADHVAAVGELRPPRLRRQPPAGR